MSESAPLLSNAAGLGSHAHRRAGVPRLRRLAARAAKMTVKQIININALLAFVPLGLVSGILDWDPVMVSVFNFLAIIPLSGFVSDASDTLADRWGPLIGGLFNASFGNAVELIVGILAINRDQIPLAQAMMLGSILSDILLVLGASLIIAARGKGFMEFNMAVVNTLSSLMLIATLALVLPTALYSTLPRTAGIDVRDKITTFSRATALVLLMIYVIYLYFQLKTHTELFLDHDDGEDTSDQDVAVEEETPGEADSVSENREDDDIPSEREVYTALAILLVSAATIMKCVQYFIDSIDEAAEVRNVSKTFIGAILLPIASNAPEAWAVAAASRKKRINDAIGVIVGSILQIALFVLPLLVVIGWLVGKKMNLYFETSQTCMLFLAVLMVNQVLQGGWYTYLHGMMLLSLYAAVALVYIVEPYQ